MAIKMHNSHYDDDEVDILSLPTSARDGKMFHKRFVLYCSFTTFNNNNVNELLITMLNYFTPLMDYCNVSC